jgi:hypothetical protein
MKLTLSNFFGNDTNPDSFERFHKIEGCVITHDRFLGAVTSVNDIIIKISL